jgi:Cytochrome P450
VRRVTLGDAARDDTALTDLLARLRAQGNWAMFAPRRPALTAAFLDRLRAHLARAEPGSLAAVAAATPADAHTAGDEQVPQWLFAYDAAGISSFRALALLATHPGEMAAVRDELAGSTGAPAELGTLRAALLEAVRLWPTTPAILRETSRATELGGATLEPGTLVLICSAFPHRDAERRSWADDFTPRLWTDTHAEPARATLVPFSAGPAVCPGRNLVLFLTSTFLAAVLEGHDVRVTSRTPIRPGRPLPGTLDPFHLRFALTGRPPEDGPDRTALTADR